MRPWAQREAAPLVSKRNQTPRCGEGGAACAGGDPLSLAGRPAPTSLPPCPVPTLTIAPPRPPFPQSAGRHGQARGDGLLCQVSFFFFFFSPAERGVGREKSAPRAAPPCLARPPPPTAPPIPRWPPPDVLGAGVRMAGWVREAAQGGPPPARAGAVGARGKAREGKENASAGRFGGGGGARAPRTPRGASPAPPPHPGAVPNPPRPGQGWWKGGGGGAWLCRARRAPQASLASGAPSGPERSALAPPSLTDAHHPPPPPLPSPAQTRRSPGPV